MSEQNELSQFWKNNKGTITALLAVGVILASAFAIALII